MSTKVQPSSALPSSPSLVASALPGEFNVVDLIASAAVTVLAAVGSGAFGLAQTSFDQLGRIAGEIGGAVRGSAENLTIWAKKQIANSVAEKVKREYGVTSEGLAQAVANHFVDEAYTKFLSSPQQSVEILKGFLSTEGSDSLKLNDSLLCVMHEKMKVTFPQLSDQTIWQALQGIVRQPQGLPDIVKALEKLWNKPSEFTAYLPPNLPASMPTVSRSQWLALAGRVTQASQGGPPLKPDDEALLNALINAVLSGLMTAAQQTVGELTGQQTASLERKSREIVTSFLVGAVVPVNATRPIENIGQNALAAMLETSLRQTQGLEPLDAGKVIESGAWGALVGSVFNVLHASFPGQRGGPALAGDESASLALEPVKSQRSQKSQKPEPPARQEPLRSEGAADGTPGRPGNVSNIEPTAEAQAFLDNYQLYKKEPQTVPGVSFKKPLPSNAAVFETLEEARSAVARIIAERPSAEMSIQTAMLRTDQGKDLYLVRLQPGTKYSVRGEDRRINSAFIDDWARENGFTYSTSNRSDGHNHPDFPFLYSMISLPSGTSMWHVTLDKTPGTIKSGSGEDIFYLLHKRIHHRWWSDFKDFEVWTPDPLLSTTVARVTADVRPGLDPSRVQDQLLDAANRKDAKAYQRVIRESFVFTKEKYNRQGDLILSQEEFDIFSPLKSHDPTVMRSAQAALRLSMDIFKYIYSEDSPKETIFQTTLTVVIAATLGVLLSEAIWPTDTKINDQPKDNQLKDDQD